MFPKSLSFGSFRTSTAAAAAILVLCSVPASAADKVTFLTSSFAQAEHGSFYQAKATGIYRNPDSTSHSRWAARRSMPRNCSWRARPIS